MAWDGCIKGCGMCCGIFSVFAIVFLCVVGGILKSGSEVIDVSEDQRVSAGNNCFIGAAIYAGFLVVSLGCFFIPCPGRNKNRGDAEAQDISVSASAGGSSNRDQGRQRLMAIRQQE